MQSNKVNQKEEIGETKTNNSYSIAKKNFVEASKLMCFPRWNDDKNCAVFIYVYLLSPFIIPRHFYLTFLVYWVGLLFLQNGSIRSNNTVSSSNSSFQRIPKLLAYIDFIYSDVTYTSLYPKTTIYFSQAVYFVHPHGQLRELAFQFSHRGTHYWKRHTRSFVELAIWYNL